MWVGVGLAVVASLIFGAILTFTSAEMDFRAQEAFGGIMSIVAVVFVTWMIFWMRSQAHHLKGELQHKMADAASMGSVAVATCAFLAVGREGLETALFIWPTLRANGGGTSPAVGAFGGLALAVGVGWLFYRGSVSLNLATFFRVTGAALVVVAAGVLAYGVHDLQEANRLPGLQSLAFDVSETIPPTSWYGTLIKGVFNISPATTWLQLIAYLGYGVPVMGFFLRPVRPVAPVPGSSAGPDPARHAADDEFVN